MSIRTYRIILFTIIVVAVCAFTVYSLESTSQSSRLQENIADKIIRFHVIANSDSDEDQQLKMIVKNEVVKEASNLLVDAKSLEETRSILLANMERITGLAQSIAEQEGYDYIVDAKIIKRYFPIKTYGDLTFPNGEYEALQITIGDAKGKNWWCVMYPRLCFVDSLYAVVPEESKEELQSVLTQEEYEHVLYNKKAKVKVKSKLAEGLKNLIDKYSESR